MSKKLRICIITDDHKVKSDQYLHQAITNRGHEVIVIDQSTSDIKIGADRELVINSSVLDIDSIDAVISQTWGLNNEKAHQLQNMMELRGVFAINPAQRIKLCDSKIESQNFFGENCIESPRSYIIRKEEFFKLKSHEFEMFFNSIEKCCVIKAEFGTQGKQVKFAYNIEEARNSSELFLSENMGVVVQEFIPSLEDRGQDLRVVVIGGFVVGGLLRTAKRGSLLSNTSLGATGEYVMVKDISSEQRKVAERCAELSGMGMLGIDLMGDKNNPLVIEINDAPQLDWFIERFDLPVHSMIVKYIEDCLGGN